MLEFQPIDISVNNYASLVSALTPYSSYLANQGVLLRFTNHTVVLTYENSSYLVYDPAYTDSTYTDSTYYGMELSTYMNKGVQTYPGIVGIRTVS